MLPYGFGEMVGNPPECAPLHYRTMVQRQTCVSVHSDANRPSPFARDLVHRSRRSGGPPPARQTRVEARRPRTPRNVFCEAGLSRKGPNQPGNGSVRSTVQADTPAACAAGHHVQGVCGKSPEADSVQLPVIHRHPGPFHAQRSAGRRSEPGACRDPPMLHRETHRSWMEGTPFPPSSCTVTDVSLWLSLVQDPCNSGHRYPNEAVRSVPCDRRCVSETWVRVAERGFGRINA